MLSFYKKFSQGISVGTCGLMSFLTIGYMMDDAHKIEKRKLILDYENRIKALNDEIQQIKVRPMV